MTGFVVQGHICHVNCWFIVILKGEKQEVPAD